MSAGDCSGDSEPHDSLADMAGQVMQSARTQRAVDDCNGSTIAGSWHTSSSSSIQSALLGQSRMPGSLAMAPSGLAGSNQQGAIACRWAQEVEHRQRSPHRASPASAKRLPASTVHEAFPEQLLHPLSKPDCQETGPTAAAVKTENDSGPVIPTDQPAPSTAGLSSDRLPNLQEASQVLEAALASCNEQQLAAGIYVAVRALSVGSGAAAELPQATKVGQQSFDLLADDGLWTLKFAARPCLKLAIKGSCLVTTIREWEP